MRSDQYTQHFFLIYQSMECEQKQIVNEAMYCSVQKTINMDSTKKQKFENIGMQIKNQINYKK